mmetsp:Transcript_2406/g.6101  ORF Transcript_2406/g.6101 Transcript_2406/m.6101 type:complete len:285 (+) Transcript_2406:196-1050(+)
MARGILTRCSAGRVGRRVRSPCIPCSRCLVFPKARGMAPMGSRAGSDRRCRAFPRGSAPPPSPLRIMLPHLPGAGEDGPSRGSRGCSPPPCALPCGRAGRAALPLPSTLPRSSSWRSRSSARRPPWGRRRASWSSRGAPSPPRQPWCRGRPPTCGMCPISFPSRRKRGSSVLSARTPCPGRTSESGGSGTMGGCRTRRQERAWCGSPCPPSWGRCAGPWQSAGCGPRRGRPTRYYATSTTRGEASESTSTGPSSTRSRGCCPWGRRLSSSSRLARGAGHPAGCC